jgi:hypothetical protein
MIFYRAAIILHPGCKFEYFEDKWSKYHHKNWIKRCKEDFRKLYNEYTLQFATKEYLDTTEESDEPSANPYLEFNKLSVKHRAKKRRRISQYLPDTEFDRYMKYFNHRDEKIKDPLEW